LQNIRTSIRLRQDKKQSREKQMTMSKTQPRVGICKGAWT
jgi:hypothetical protein